MRGAVFQGRLDQAALQTLVPPAAGLALFRGVDAFAFAPDGQGWAYAGSSGEITLRLGSELSRIDSGDKVGEMNPSFNARARADSFRDLHVPGHPSL